MCIWSAYIVYIFNIWNTMKKKYEYLVSYIKIIFWCHILCLKNIIYQNHAWYIIYEIKYHIFSKKKIIYKESYMVYGNTKSYIWKKKIWIFSFIYGIWNQIWIFFFHNISYIENIYHICTLYTHFLFQNNHIFAQKLIIYYHHIPYMNLWYHIYQIKIVIYHI